MLNTKVQPLQEVTDQLFNVGLILDREHSEAATAVWAIRDAARQAAMRERNAADQKARVTKRIAEANEYIQRMRRERIGWGKEAEAEADQTAASLLTALVTLNEADDVWCDGATGYSFAGFMHGIHFGMLAFPQPCRDEFTSPPLRWSFHS
jgi:hypothetical protein